MAFHVPERWRMNFPKGHPLYSDLTYGNNGAFQLPGGIAVIASDGEGWEHASASFSNRCPSWDDMCRVKAEFWDDEDCVVQYHPPKSQYVNCHPYTLHLWREIGVEIPLPPSIMVGPR